MTDDLEQLLKEAYDWATNEVWYHEANRLKVQRLVAIVRRQRDAIARLKWADGSSASVSYDIAHHTEQDCQAIARGEK